MYSTCIPYCVYVCYMHVLVLIHMCSIRSKDLSLPAPSNEDEAVSKERRRVLQVQQADGDLLVLRNLTKIYGTRCSSQYRLAVNQLCLRMQKAEVCMCITMCIVNQLLSMYMYVAELRLRLYILSVLYVC